MVDKQIESRPEPTKYPIEYPGKYPREALPPPDPTCISTVGSTPEPTPPKSYGLSPYSRWEVFWFFVPVAILLALAALAFVRFGLPAIQR